VVTLRKQQSYDEVAERRSYLNNWCNAFAFRTDEEQAVAFAYHANSIREKSRLMKSEHRERVLIEIANALPIDDPLVTYELRDGITAFHERVLDRIWLEHQNLFQIARCLQCSRILKSPQARQCLWCGADWHSQSG
jgi:hypothetical protein